MIQLKDYRIGEIKLPEGEVDMKAFMQAFTNRIEFAELGESSLPIKECIKRGLRQRAYS